MRHPDAKNVVCTQAWVVCQTHIATAERHVQALFFTPAGHLRPAFAANQQCMVRALNAAIAQAAAMHRMAAHGDVSATLHAARAWYAAVRRSLVMQRGERCTAD